MHRPHARTLTLVVLVVGAALGAAGWVAARPSGAAEAPAAAGAPVMADVDERTADIAFYTRRASKDPESAEDRAQLAALYLQRGRETGDYEDYRRADSVARASLALRTARNGKTFLTRASALLAQHRFAEAREVAEEAVRADSSAESYRGLLGETELELGDYDAARSTFASLDAVTASLSVAPRLARWAELNGRTEDARRILRNALAQTTLTSDLPAEQEAWFYYRVGDLELRTGRLAAAERAFAGGLAVEPNDYRILGGMARLEAVRHRPARAAEYGERAIAVVLDPATLGVVSDAYAALGDRAKSEEYARAMEVAVAGQPGPYHRAWSLFLLDHGRRVPEVLAKAQEELATRRDIYGYDLVAWALHKAGRDGEASAAMRQALRLGTRDALLFYHAGMIERALGHGPAAERYLEAALATNPSFHPTQPAEARATLDSLRAARGTR
jgi:tetratricopeptide (TPR) repeat protein